MVRSSASIEAPLPVLNTDISRTLKAGSYINAARLHRVRERRQTRAWKPPVESDALYHLNATAYSLVG